ncbi:hypothetical protein B0H63DRAFT_538425 [Podospora didyma]|uniref:NDT80 domain-containing protein n=1 Tax=Podospora didyma TaxID=330526 RepID=A0AAE0NYX7_9PEZI|nr:hypothetical protein B0H63DRAFT_538425 [Podospora didyma]
MGACFGAGGATWDHYTQDSTSSLSTIEAPAQPPPYLTLIPPIPPPVTAYSPEGGHFYPPAPPVFSSLDVRPRLGSNSSTSGTGMAHAPRSTALPHPGSQLSTRDLYSSATPTFSRRPDHHIPRSPSFPGIRRHPLSPTPSPVTYNPLKMDAGYGTKNQQNIPPLNSMVSLGTLNFIDSPGSPVKVDINGTIDKGFFLADNEWTCYRRNYFSCVCSYSITPSSNAPMHFVQTGNSSSQAFTIYGFAMCISAVVADNDTHAIELVQHTPKRDKGPVAKPEKVRLAPKQAQASHHPLALYGAGEAGLTSSRGYDQPAFGAQQHGSLPTEHTFERIQFKQATANNGKRRAAQQYYHLIVELWGDLGSQGGTEQFIKIAYRKSAKMIVRGRSPGHYQSERRGSTSSGPGGSGGGSIGGGYSTSMMGPGEYSSSSSMMQGGYGASYDPRSSYGNSRHHHELTMEPMISPEEAKAITEPKGYMYFPSTITEGEQDTRHHHHHSVELFAHGRNEHEGGTSASISGAYEATKVKPELEHGLPSLFYPGNSYYTQRCGRFEPKASSSGYYPTAVPPSSTMNMT